MKSPSREKCASRLPPGMTDRRSWRRRLRQDAHSTALLCVLSWAVHVRLVRARTGRQPERPIVHRIGDYADLRIMPTSSENPLPRKGLATLNVGMIRADHRVCGSQQRSDILVRSRPGMRMPAARQNARMCMFTRGIVVRCVKRLARRRYANALQRLGSAAKRTCRPPEDYADLARVKPLFCKGFLGTIRRSA